VAPVKQSGHVDFLVFEDMNINGHSVDVAEYQHEFDLPNKKPATLNSPLAHFYLPAQRAAGSDWRVSRIERHLAGHRARLCIRKVQEEYFQFQAGGAGRTKHDHAKSFEGEIIVWAPKQQP
jgi:hypothetical protein